MKYIFLILLIICSLSAARSQETNVPAYPSPEGKNEPGKAYELPVSRGTNETDKVNITKSNNGLKDEWNTKSKFGQDEEWIYSGTFSNGYLYFENGIMTRFQN